MKKYIPNEKKISMIMEMLLALDCDIFAIDYETGLLNMSINLDTKDYDEDEDDDACPCFDPDEDDEDEEREHCIHCCPECGSCMLGLGGEDC